MKFVEGENNNNSTENNGPLFKDESPIDLLKSESGYENISEKSDIVQNTEPVAEPITTPEVLDFGIQEPLNNPVPEMNVENVFEKQEEAVSTPPVMENTPPVESFTPPVDNNDNFMVPKKKKGKGLLLTLLLLLVVAGGLFAYYTFALSGEKVFSKIVNGGYKEASVLDAAISSKFNLSTTTSSEGSITLSGDLLGDMKDINADYSLGLDTINEKFNVDLDLKSGEDSLLSLLFFMKEDTAYVDVDNITPKMIKFDAKEYSDALFEVTKEEKTKVEIAYLYKVVADAVTKTASKDKMTRSISFKETGTTLLELKLVYDIDSEEMKSLYTAALTALKNDDKALSMIAELLQEEKSVVASNLTDLLEEIKNVEYVSSKLTVYSDLLTNKLISINIEEKGEVSSDIKYSHINELHKLEVKIKEENSTSTMLLTYNEKDSKITVTAGNEENAIELNIDTNIVDKKTNRDIRLIVTDVKTSKKLLELAVKDANQINTEFKEPDTTTAASIEELSDQELTELGMGLSFVGEMLDLDSIIGE